MAPQPLAALDLLDYPDQLARRIGREVLAIVAYRQPIARSGIELIRGSASDSALDTLVERGLITRNQHELFVTTRAFLDFMALRDLADLPPLAPDTADHTIGHSRLCS